jgi:rhodanese-related sulfurtransferase
MTVVIGMVKKPDGIIVRASDFINEYYKEVAMFFQSQGFDNITPDGLREKMEKGDDFILLDVRSPGEYAADAIEGSRLLPVQELSLRVRELPSDKEIIVYCRVGNRSAFAASYLSQLGYTVKNLEGGILAWNMAQENAFAAVS